MSECLFVQGIGFDRVGRGFVGLKARTWGKEGDRDRGPNYTA